jgi:hypothetical protein
MKRTLWALVAILLMAGLSRAEYVVIIANLGAGGAADPMGMGMMGGTPGDPMGIPPMGPMGPGGGFRGSGAGGPMGPGGPMGGGFRGGMPGPGMPGTGMPGMPGFGFGSTPDSEAADELATLVIVVLEVRCNTIGYVKGFEAGEPYYFHHKWDGGRAALKKKFGIYEVSLVPGSDGKPMPTVAQRFYQREKEVFASMIEKPSTERVLGLARTALDYGLLDKFVETMDKLAEIDKDGPQVKRYKALKAALEKPMPDSAEASMWRGKVLSGYRVAQKPDNHFALIHGYPSDDSQEVKAHLARLERTFRGIYYWWAMQNDGGALPMPKQRLVSVLVPADSGDDFNKLKRALSANSIVADSFLARREGVAVYSSRRGDEHYEAMEGATKGYWQDGYDRIKLLKGQPRWGIPRSKWGASNDDETHLPRAGALVLKALESEWEMNAATHEVARQLPFATGMLAPKVHAPEWIQFGMGSLFEAPLQSPWHGIGIANSYYLPRFKESHKAGKYGDPKSDAGKLAALTGVVTDGFFRAKPGKGADGKDESAEAVKRRARAAAWSLTWFLAKNDLPGLQAYFKELSKLPRDVELDHGVLLKAFATAFRCTQDGKISDARLTELANRWLTNVNRHTMEGDKIHEQIRKAYATIKKNPLGSPAGGPMGGMGPMGPMGPGGLRN